MPFATDDPIYAEQSPKVTFPVLALSIALFASSLCNFCFCTQTACRTSIEALLLGWCGIPEGGASIAWLANPLLAIAWVLLARNKKAAWILALAASLLCLSFLKSQVVIDNEAGLSSPILKIRIGYWLWLSSSMTTFLGSLIIKLFRYFKTHNS